MSESERFVLPPEGEDPRERDHQLSDPEAAYRLQEERQVTHDQPRHSEMGITSDYGGVDPGGYPRSTGPGVTGQQLGEGSQGSAAATGAVEGGAARPERETTPPDTEADQQSR